MTGTRYEATASPACAAAARVVLVGEPTPLRAAVARRLRAATALLACLDTPARLLPVLSSAAPAARPGSAARPSCS
jgi:hypothetical protein